MGILALQGREDVNYSLPFLVDVVIDSNSDVDAVEAIEDVHLPQLAGTENASVQHVDIRPTVGVEIFTPPRETPPWET